MRRLFVAAFAVTAFAAFGLTAGAQDEKVLPPDHSITVVKEVENGPDDASYVIEVHCDGNTFILTFGENGGSETISVPNDSGECTVVEPQDNGAVVDIEGNGACVLPASEWYAESYVEPDIVVPGYWEPAEGSSCAFEVSNFFEPPVEVTPPPEIIVTPPSVIEVPVPVLRTPQFTG